MAIIPGPRKLKARVGFCPPERVRISKRAKPPLTGRPLLFQRFQLLEQQQKYAIQRASNCTEGFAEVVSAVHMTPNFISSVNASAAIGGILWQQVLGHFQIPNDYYPIAHRPQKREQLRGRFEAALRDGKEVFTPNRDYDHKFDPFPATIGIPHGRNFMEDVHTFKEIHGKVVKWTVSLPLIQSFRSIDGKTSLAAKTKHDVSAPHDSSTLEKIWDYVSTHKLALSMPPAVAALNFIPGLGEAADEAELVALCVDSVDSIELARLGSSSLSAESGIGQALRVVAELKIE